MDCILDSFQGLVAVPLGVAGVDNTKDLVRDGHGGFQNNYALAGLGNVIKLFLNVTSACIGFEFVCNITVTPGHVCALAVEVEVDGLDSVFVVFADHIRTGVAGTCGLGNS